MIHNIKEFSSLLQESLACFSPIMYPPKHSIYTKVYSSHPHVTKGRMTEKKMQKDLTHLSQKRRSISVGYNNNK